MKTKKERLILEIRNMAFLHPYLVLSRTLPASLDYLSVTELESLRYRFLNRIQRQSGGSEGCGRTSKNRELTLQTKEMGGDGV